MQKFEEEYDEEVEQVVLPEAQKDYLLPCDFLFGGIVGAIIIALLSFWSFPGLNPSVWEGAAIASTLRPPESIFPGFWYTIAHWIFGATGFAGGLKALHWLGSIFLGLTIWSAYILLVSSMSLLTIKRPESARRYFVVTRLSAALGALFFGCADPVWRLGQTFSPESLLLFLTIFSFVLFVVYLQTSKLPLAYLSMLLLGLLTAETPMGLVLLIAVVSLYVVSNRYGIIIQPIIEKQVSIKWFLTFFFVLGFISGIAANCISFISMDGLAALGITGGDVPLLYVTRYWDIFISCASLMGWVLSVAIVILPFALTIFMARRASDVLYFLPYHIGVLFVICGIVSFAQLASLSPLWYWQWITDPVMFNSQYFLAVLILFSVATVAFSLLIFGIDVFCRDHHSIAITQYEVDGEYEEAKQGRFLDSFKFACFCMVPVLLVLAVVPGRRLTDLRNILQIINDYAEQIIEECGDAKWIFTDGSFDSHLELLAATKGKQLSALAMMAGNEPRETYIRARGIEDQEDLLALSKGAAMLLRTWVRDKTQRHKDFAIQLGFELWKRDGKEIPMCAGVLARPSGMAEKDRLGWVEKSKVLAKRVLDVYKVHGGISKSVGNELKELFLFAQWRISRIARMRAEVLDRLGKTDAAIADVALSKALDDNNESFRQILKGMEKVRQMTLKQVTPREGLQLALARADFALARHYGEAVIESDPDNVDANFGLGMSYFMQEQWSRAETYLRRCLVRNPNEPAVYNNLAIIKMKLKQFDEAEKLVKKALSIIPDSAEVKDTFVQILKAKEEAAKPKQSAK